MNGQPINMMAFKLKKLMAQAADGTDVSDAVRELLEADRQMRVEQIGTGYDGEQTPVLFAEMHAI